MTKTRLQFEYDYDFCLVGIVCHEKDYRLCWALNTLFGIKLAKTDDHATEHSLHSMFSYNHEELFRDYHLIANRGKNGLLVEEHKQVDYFFIVKGQVDDDERKQLAEQIKKTDLIGGAYIIDAQQLKSKHNLVF
ncbi:MAG: IPExxxVDY family protein [Bacteroidia bacterium]|jgi:hypothetical protein